MSATTQVALTGAWQAIATAGEVAFSPTHHCVWATTDTTTAPAFAGGHSTHPTETVTMTLSGTERLWVKGDGSVYVNADAPVV